MNPTYNLLEIRDLLKSLKNDRTGLINLIDIVVEDAELYTEPEINLITDMINYEANKLT